MKLPNSGSEANVKWQEEPDFGMLHHKCKTSTNKWTIDKRVSTNDHSTLSDLLIHT